MGQAQETINRFYAAFAAGDFDAALECWHADGHATDPAIGTVDVAGWRAYGEGFKRAMPDARHDVDSWVEQGDHVAVEGRFSGTHTGPLVAPDGTEIPPSGRLVEVAYAAHMVVRDGRIASERIYFDRAALAEQLMGAQAAAA